MSASRRCPPCRRCPRCPFPRPRSAFCPRDCVMPDEIEDLRRSVSDNLIELKVLASQFGEHLRVSDNRHNENKAALTILEKESGDNRHALNNVNTKIDNLNVELIGWPYQQG